MKIVSIVGARPQFIKAAPVSRAIQAHNDSKGCCHSIREILVHTGQHYDYNMSQVFFDQLEIPDPDYHLGVGSGRHGEMTGIMLIKIEEVLLKEKPDLVLIYGDTNSTLAGALTAAKLNIPVAHVEAGLRSFNRRMPEEINRLVTDHLSSLLFCPTQTAVENLSHEGITNVDNLSLSVAVNPHSPMVLNVGDVMYDAFLFNKDVAARSSPILKDLGLNGEGYFLATVHRQENTDDPVKLKNIFSAFSRLAREDSPIIAPLHPRTKKVLDGQEIEGMKNPNLRVIPPVSYLDIIALEANARVILTDSGGIQKEAYFVHVPCVTLRSETEWVETVDAGWNKVAGDDPDSIVQCAELARPGRDILLYGNGHASEEIVRHISAFLMDLCQTQTGAL